MDWKDPVKTVRVNSILFIVEKTSERMGTRDSCCKLVPMILLGAFNTGCCATFCKHLSELAHLRWHKNIQTRNSVPSLDQSLELVRVSYVTSVLRLAKP